MEQGKENTNTNPSIKKKEIDYARSALDRLRAISDWSPREYYRYLEVVGYVGQDDARKKLCLMAYRHVRRLKDHFLCNIPLEDLSQKSNVLMLGPTGCGKTHLAELLFQQVLNIPVVIVDTTQFVETGYMGKNVSEIMSDLLTSAGGNPYWAKMGICVLDEFDKIAGSGTHLRFGGAGTNKDVSGYGVQRGLLKLIEGGTQEVSTTPPWEKSASFETDCIGFVACGAFSGIENIIPSNQNSEFGFSSNQNTTKNIVNDNKKIPVDTFTKYGFLPELIGRFNSICHLHPLNKKDLSLILQKNVLPRYKQEFEREGQTLEVPTRTINKIIDQALQRKTGARGIALLLEEYFENRAFESFGKNDTEKFEDSIPF